ncbi:MAG: accessory factor UbiK family protein, partial [Gammaproteobacteria bacterium]|nr:accessory factor UbiK family protein [Gammaproteobacteria bacterium]
MTGTNHINDIVQKVLDALPEGLKNAPDDIRQNLRDAVGATFNKLDLVTREEFDIQKKVLLRTREKLEALEKQLAELEQQ